MTEPENDPDQRVEDEAPFVSHLIELRDRLIRAVIGIVLVLVALFPFAQDIYTTLALPLMRTLPGGSQMIAIEPAGPLITPLKLVAILAVFITMPWTLYQLWQFVAPGLYRHERRFGLPLLASSVLLFYAGAAFAYFVVFRLIFGFLTSIVPEGVTMTPDITKYLDFVLTLFFAFGVAFEVPIATIILVAVGATTPENLASKRPYVIVGAFVIGMLLTPPDIISQVLLAVPMWVLYELGIVFARIFVTRPRERAAAVAAGSGGSGGDGDGGGDGGDGNGGGDGGDGTGGHGGGTPGVASSAGDDDEPYRPLSEEEMDAELDRIEREEDAGTSQQAAADDEAGKDGQDTDEDAGDGRPPRDRE